MGGSRYETRIDASTPSSVSPLRSCGWHHKRGGNPRYLKHQSNFKDSAGHEVFISAVSLYYWLGCFNAEDTTSGDCSRPTHFAFASPSRLAGYCTRLTQRHALVALLLPSSFPALSFHPPQHENDNDDTTGALSCSSVLLVSSSPVSRVALVPPSPSPSPPLLPLRHDPHPTTSRCPRLSLAPDDNNDDALPSPSPALTLSPQPTHLDHNVLTPTP